MRTRPRNLLAAMLAVASLPARQTVTAPVSIIVNLSNPVEEMTSNRLREVLFGNVREWPTRRRITVVQREPASPVAASVLKSFVGMSPEEYNRYLLNQQFRGQQPVAIKTLLSDESACSFVFNAPGAIGFISTESLNKSECQSQIRVVRVSGRADSPNRW